ncbi:hypothetical protein A1Q1_00507 [Trichosporon asahii var. asahii CBS 2479]|uniref:F-box domain-containing protein n=1 Tax=Trichosporon asahii var. asahii (strain ATCC 90039 / CBS 2479 / JCM 2466 / KCTC 7840 / NBRC 103889/ NCYC 2677 / UAMH 7654) TaxID=1186058 RepID=J5TC26_TRIAS|nr:hypothetical protein A1Q1_00507 [Trichosporon asahii var. asahii CBS 2479]EJT50206.1 hypothetical protein A1Q1_00507 [Trichosporon asahii var. asahii CBS 2479]
MLSPLPAEVLLAIAEHLEVRDLTTLLRVNTFFHSIFVGPAYRCVEAHVQTLNVRPHHSDVCKNVPEHSLIHVKLVRLYATSARVYHLVHEEDLYPPSIWQGPDDFSGAFNEDFLRWTQRAEPACGFLRSIRTDTIVITEAALSGSSSVGDLQGWAADVKRVILFLPPAWTQLTSVADALYHSPGPSDDGLEPLIPTGMFLQFAPPRAQSFTAVVQHPGISWYGLSDPASIDSFADALLKGPRTLLRGVVDVLEDFGCPVSSLHRLWPVLKQFTLVLPEGLLSSDCRDYLVQEIETRLREYDAPADRPPMPTVRILSMLEFMALPEYKDVMTPKQMALWSERSVLPHFNATREYVKQCVEWSRRRRELLLRKYPNYERHGSFEASLGPPPW